MDQSNRERELRDLSDLAGAHWERSEGVTFAVIDHRTQARTILLVFARPWTRGGFRWTESAGLSAKPPSAVANKLKELNCPVLWVIPANSTPSEDCVDAFVDFEVVQSTDDGQFEHVTRRLAWPRKRINRSFGTTLSLTTRLQHRLERVDLPVHVQVKLPANELSRAILEVTVQNAHARGLPERAWFRVEGTAGASGVLTIDIEPSSHGDQWDLSFEGSRHAVVPIDPPQPEGESKRDIDRLAVIFDRTCPDCEGWFTAYQVATRGFGAEEPRNDSSEWESSAEQPRSSSTLKRLEACNEHLRHGLGEALARWATENNCTVDGWWFADVERDGVAPPEGVDLPREPFGALGSGASPSSLFKASGYSPGLDLWDPLELALRDAVSALRRDTGRHGAVLIVGNSPPSVPTNPQSPLRRLTSLLGHPTAYRGLDTHWEDTLREAAAAGLPIVYLFLTHPADKVELPQEVRGNHERFVHLQDQVAEALSACVEVRKAAATPSDLPGGIRSALHALTSRDLYSSLLEVRVP